MLFGNFRQSVDAKEAHRADEAEEQSGPHKKEHPPGLSAQAQGTALLMETMPGNSMKAAKLQS